MIKVVLIGGGNVAFHLASHFLENKQVNLVQVYNRHIDSIKYLENKTSITNTISNLKEADIYIISISDDAISEFSSQLILKNKLVVHTSGSVSVNELQSTSNKGVFYLLQSFSKNRKVDLNSIPICIEAEHKTDLALLEILAKSISSKVFHINSDQRKNLHVGAVFVNNFVNHLYYIGYKLCKEKNVSFDVLKPLILETALKLNDIRPFEAQTGPAKRNDEKTIHKHLAMLSNTEKDIYELLTKSISKTYE